ncbi:uncharacterized protein LOC141646657 [Silene latifolia]|uniref:uncharacterized protein LOC141646657 n=1 Tax=Silene latifolia TaxID=37657 RepID=UPI003D77DC9B
MDVFCGMCGVSSRILETVEHLFQDCESARRIWAGSELGIRVDNVGSLSITDWIIDWIKLLSGKEGGERRVIMLVAVLWGLWSLRNRNNFEGLELNWRSIVDFFYVNIREKVRVLNEQVEGGKLRAVMKGSPEERMDTVRWRIKEGYPLYLIGRQDRCAVIRVKVDASWDKTYMAAFGWVAFDSTGQEILRRSVKIRAEAALQAEALGIRDVLIWAASEGILHLDISSDCLQLINEIAGVEKEDHLLADMWGTFGLFHCLCINFIPRHFNTLAHGVARQAMRL